MKRDDSLETITHFTMSVAGGLISVYGLVMRSDFLGTAQTSNMIYLLKDALGYDLGDIFIRIGALMLYALAIGLTVYLPKRSSVDLRLVSIWIDVAAVLIMSFLPVQMDPILGLYPVFFAMAFQWCSFRGVGEYASSTIFSTNNLRQFVSALVSYRMDRNQTQARKARFYGFTLCSFYTGVLLGFVLCPVLGVHSVLLAWVPLAAALVLVHLLQPEDFWLKQRRLALAHRK